MAIHRIEMFACNRILWARLFFLWQPFCVAQRLLRFSWQQQRSCVYCINIVLTYPGLICYFVMMFFDLCTSYLKDNLSTIQV